MSLHTQLSDSLSEDEDLSLAEAADKNQHLGFRDENQW